MLTTQIVLAANGVLNVFHPGDGFVATLGAGREEEMDDPDFAAKLLGSEFEAILVLERKRDDRLVRHLSEQRRPLLGMSRTGDGKRETGEEPTHGPTFH